MINRTLIRIKVIQILFSFYKGAQSGVDSAKNELILSLDKSYELYMLLLRLSVDVCNYAADVKKRKNEVRSVRGAVEFEERDKMPADFFAENKVVDQISKCSQLNDFLEKHKTGWEGRNDLILALYKEVMQSKTYADALAEDQNYDNDKKFLRAVYRDVFAKSDILSEELERLSIYWNDDEEIVTSFVMKTISQYQEAEGEDKELLPKYKDANDETFALTLLTKVIYNEAEYHDLINENCKNWDVNRIAFMDIIIMQSAIAELISFPQIPVDVTMNEYIEIAKFYSTGKSSSFVNGILDAVLKKLKADGKLVKAASIKKTQK